MRIVALAALLLIALCVACIAQGPVTVLCQGNSCGGGGMRNYQYDVSAATGVTFNHIHIGTCDPNINNYTNILMPPGWQFMGITSYYGSHNGFTPHGGLSNPTGTHVYSVAWGGPAINNGVFGFDNPNEPHDVNWEVVSSAGTVWENWSFPVGLGIGPVHGPVPEPSSMIALGLGLILAWSRRKRA